MGQQTPLYQQHVTAAAKLVDFYGWDMPLHYGSQLKEHLQVRQDAGVFDVSHMTILDIKGKDARQFLRKLLANDVARLQQQGKAMYTCMLNEQAGIIDDLICYYLAEEHYRLVVNSSTHDKDIAWIKQQAQPFTVTVEEDADSAMIAVQGPKALTKLQGLLTAKQSAALMALDYFTAAKFDDLLIARTGYTGEAGVEMIIPKELVAKIWDALLAAGVQPCGLGARDTLRLEAGMNLYGSDMDESVTPLESGLGWCVSWHDEQRDFIGKAALLKQKADGVPQRLIGLLLNSKGVLRAQQTVVVEGVGEGKITSGTFSPTLSCGIAMARVPAFKGNPIIHVQIRKQLVPVQRVKMPFVRNGKQVYEIFS